MKKGEKIRMGLKKEHHFCETNKCTCLVLISVIAGLVVVACITFLAPDVRSKVSEELDVLKWWQKAIIYQIYPRSFQDSDGDGLGDLQGIISRLYYFNELQIEAIWLSPFLTSPMRDFGYDIANYTEVDHKFGKMSDFDELVKKAHEKGIKVIIDFVPNHTSNESSWFNRSRHEEEEYKDYYIWSKGKASDGKTEPPNNWTSVFEGSAWQWDENRQAYYYHAFLDSQPDLNYRNDKVKREMKNVLRFWLDRGVDGFRIDAIPHLFEKEDLNLEEPPGPANSFNPNLHMHTKNQPEIFDVVTDWKHVLDEYEAKDGKSRFLVAETVGIPKDARQKYYEAGSVPFFFNLIASKEKCGATAACLLDIIKEGLDLKEGQWPNFVIGNHDNKRIADRMGYMYADAMNMLLLTLPGTPTTYYGEELGMQGGDYQGRQPQDPYALTSNNWANSRDSERNPMQWNTSLNAGFTAGTPWLETTPNTDYMHVNVEVQEKNPTSSLSLYKRLVELRRQPSFQNAKCTLPIDGTDLGNILLYIRGLDNEVQYLVALNLGTQPDAIQLGGNGTVVFSTHNELLVNSSVSNIALNAGEGIVILLNN